MKVFPVVHINAVEQAVAQTEVAFTQGADGVYLIDHHARSLDDNMTLEAFGAVVQEYDEQESRYVGVNILGATSLRAYRMVHQALSEGNIVRAPDGLWVDDATRTGTGNPYDTRLFKDSLSSLRSCRLLGGVAFKYTEGYTDSPVEAKNQVEVLHDAVDVVTTSGRGTGYAPTVEKIATMREASHLVGKPLAVASGISSDNIQQYRGLIDEVLVASSVETGMYSGRFDVVKLRAFIEHAHEL